MLESLPNRGRFSLRPGKIKGLDGEYYIIGGPWILVTESFTLEDAIKEFEGGSFRIEDIQAKKTWKVSSSSGNGEYEVSFLQGSWFCSCPGFGFRKKCRHLTEIMELYAGNIK